MGYGFRWDADGDGKADTDFGDHQSVKVHLEPGKTQAVTLEVKNAFGLVGAKKMTLTRPEKMKVLEVGQNMMLDVIGKNKFTECLKQMPELKNLLKNYVLKF